MSDRKNISAIFKLLIILIFILFVAKLCMMYEGEIDIGGDIGPIRDDTVLDGAMSEDGMRFVGFKSIVIEANKYRVKSYILNPADNKVNFIAYIYIDDDILLYKSNLIPPGYAIYEMTITHPLDKGIYNAYIIYEAYDITSGEKLNGARFNFELIVK